MTGMNSAVIWLVLVIVLLAIEIATLGLTTVWFAGGAAAAFISTFFGASMGVQTGIFLVLSLILLLVTRPAAALYGKGTGKNQCGQSDRQNSRSNEGDQ